jgi:beta-glucosidase
MGYYQFPDDFLWGCATASYQVEGAAKEDGRGPSIWDTFSHSPGRVVNEHNGDVSVDQYHRYKEDVALMKWMGLKAYRFSMSWSRIFPEGSGDFNEKGMAYYDRLVDELLANGIEPWLTFFHWDLPQAMQDKFGGWESRETAKYFADYVAEVTKRISDRVTNFFTINEFFCFTDSGYVDSGAVAPWKNLGGVFPPGKNLPPKERNQVRHHALLAHGMAVQAIRANAVQKPNVGLAENFSTCVPVIETEENIAAAKLAFREENRHFLTTFMEGAYPETYLKDEGENAPEFTDDEMKIIGSPLDFVGANIYAPTYISADENSPKGYSVVPHPETYPKMNMNWLFVGPQITYWAPRMLKEIWGVKAVYITENGCACKDRLTTDNEVNDTDRVFYLRNHFISAHRAVSEGQPLKGYFVWSLLDNFEWAEGYNKRFGLIYVNYQNLERIPKLSAKFYKSTIASNSVL